MMNNEDAYATLNVRPASTFAIRSEVHALRLADAADLWYLGGGAFQTSTFGYQGRPSNGSRSLSAVADINLDHQLTRFLTVAVYYAHASGQDVITRVYPKNSHAQLAYVEATVHF